MDIVRRSQSLPLGVIIKLFMDMVDEVYFFHTVLEYAHRDIKLDNFIIDFNGKIVLLDFAQSLPISDDSSQEWHGTP
jgi:serine/threonine protein kinase